MYNGLDKIVQKNLHENQNICNTFARAVCNVLCMYGTYNVVNVNEHSALYDKVNQLLTIAIKIGSSGNKHEMYCRRKLNITKHSICSQFFIFDIFFKKIKC